MVCNGLCIYWIYPLIVGHFRRDLWVRENPNIMHLMTPKAQNGPSGNTLEHRKALLIYINLLNKQCSVYCVHYCVILYIRHMYICIQYKLYVKIVLKIFQIMVAKRGKNSWDKTYICTWYSPSKNSYEGSATIPDK